MTCTSVSFLSLALLASVGGRHLSEEVVFARNISPALAAEERASSTLARLMAEAAVEAVKEAKQESPLGQNFGKRAALREIEVPVKSRERVPFSHPPHFSLNQAVMDRRRRDRRYCGEYLLAALKLACARGRKKRFADEVTMEVSANEVTTAPQ